ncbi:SDR family NAD(P)-dependent oxidoreductase [Nitrosomonas aestuarii]|uniref:SDR family NAD(P)-dependent oxidoreductase n=1 Tax=Nitrosomonas aestuarii TaxID=52441 RepID=UPI000D2FAF72|nr:SDR family NAD(P)-dependent oxidoreductase [Nitrosomonas aestuarii]PTN11001.1 NAD(P)-dependent dehydrogenase (short-subunit alcohol dehydrogenase family) [Nitrosomonas aestuarii]
MRNEIPLYRNIVIIGASGALGGAFLTQLAKRQGTEHIYAFSRVKKIHDIPVVTAHVIDYENEASIKRAATTASKNAPLDLILVTTGILHEGALMPEKSLRDLSSEKFQRLFMVNAVVPALVAKHFLPKLHKGKRAVFAALSARIGSISDNQLGGWYSYRASKAALNMVIKNAAIEMSRRYREAIIVGLHPGTVDSNLSKPFQRNVVEDKLFTPEFSVIKLLSVIDQLSPADSGKCFAWDGQEVEP